MSWRILEKLFDSWRHIGDIVGLGVIPLKSGLNCIRLHHLISFNYKNFCKRQQPDNLNQATGFNIDYTMSINLSAKPPNIIIYNFKEYALGIQGTLGQYLDSDRYVFLNLNERQLISEPWSTNTELVIITSGENPEPVQRVLLKYLKENGKILSLGSDFLSNLKVKLLKSTNVDNDEYLQISHEVFGDTKLRLIGNLCSSESFNGQKIALCAKTNAVAIGALRDVDSHGLVVFSQVSLFGDDDDDVSSSDDYSSNRRSWKRNVILEILRHILKLECISTPERAPLKATACYLYGTNSAALCSFLSELRPRLVKDRLQGPKATFQLSELSSLQSAEVFHLQEDGLPVIPVFVDNGSGSIVDQSFSPRVYFDHLKTKVLGCVVWYGKVMTSTMDIFYSANIPQGVVCIAGRQTSGKGRGNHAWLSPEGCAMFSLQISIPMKSILGRHLTFVQHLASMAIVEGVKSIPDYENVDLKLKWPNDIYFGDRLVKVGGVIVQSTLMADATYCTIGCGLNVDNRKPTVCLNDVVKSLNPELPPLSREIVIARAITKLEELIDTFQRGQKAEILQKYYSAWLHGGARIQVTTSDGVKTPAVIDGLDDYGFLKIKLDGSSQVLTVQPDGNSFDALHNLLIVR